MAGALAALSAPPLPASREAAPPAPRPEPAWLRHAVAFDLPSDRPMVAVVIDDVGLNRANAVRLNHLAGPLTVSFMSYADDLARQAAGARAAGHEIWLHVPMEPLGSHDNPGPNVLAVALDDAELERRIVWALGRVDGIVGINNHMGSRFTANAHGMTLVMRELQRRGLAFLDSKTTAASVGVDAARSHGVAHVARDVFLDNDAQGEAIRAQLRRLEDHARRHGHAIAIGHPYDSTIAVLAEWLPTLAQRGLVLAPVSAILRKSAEGDRPRPVLVRHD